LSWSRGHRLCLLLKIDMMRWLADARRDLKIIESWNKIDNNFLIKGKLVAAVIFGRG
jgi:hypothetical protein